MASVSDHENRQYLQTLPPELLLLVFSLLPNRDIKNIRQTCKYLCDAAPLRLTRVFLSPNPHNIQVFNAIAEHDAYRLSIVEIIYDDARLSYPLETEEDTEFANLESPPPEGVPLWFARIHQSKLELAKKSGTGNMMERPDHIAVRGQAEAAISPLEAYRHYQMLVSQQEGVIDAATDVKALRHGLERFPNLRRITLTPAAHGTIFRPYYGTPMIRNFPKGFIYPIPRGWPEQIRGSNEPFAQLWRGRDEKVKWRGLLLLLRILAQHPHNITEFVMDTNKLTCGLNCHIFDGPNQEYLDLVALLQRPNFSRIDLALFIGGQEREGWHSFRSTLLHKALANAKDLKHVHLSCGLGHVETSVIRRHDSDNDGMEHFTPLSTIFPVTQWEQLQHFGLSRFIVRQDDLISLLAELPPTLQSVDLSLLTFMWSGGSYRGLVRDIRDVLKWHERPVSERPRIIIHLDVADNPHPSRFVDVSQDVEDFVYRDDKNPFGEDDKHWLNSPHQGSGFGIMRYPFEPENDHPYLQNMQLMELGIMKKSEWFLRGGRSRRRRVK